MVGVVSQVAIIMVIAAAGQSQVAETYSFGSSGEEDLGLDYGTGDVHVPIERLESHRTLINKLYGSNEEANMELWGRISSDYVDTICSLDNVWVLDEMKTRLELKGGASTLTADEKKQIADIVNEVINEELNVSKAHCKDMFHDLRRSRSHLDCALHPHVVTEYFINMFPPTECWEFTRGLWVDLIQAGDFSKNCSSVDVYNDLVHVAQIAKGRYEDANWDTEGEVWRFRLKAELTETISTPKHLPYLTRISCKEQPNPWDCPEIVRSAELTVCRPLTMATVDQIEELVKKGSFENPSTALDDMDIMMDVLSDLTKVVQELSKSKLKTRYAYVTIDTLDSYLEIMDNTIGLSAKGVWTQMSQDESQKRLQLVLVNNEEYIAAMSKILFDSKQELNSTEIEKESMALQLKKISNVGATEKVGFEFSDAEIETEWTGNGSADELSVYAIHYKSMAELTQKKGLDLGNQSQSQKDRVFVGKGGIISLSAHANEEKKSVPVSYKMKFNEVDFEGDPSTSVTRRLCLSCEYLDTTNGEWLNTGCIVDSVNSGGVTCRCNHTTNFAAFMSPVPIDIEMTDAQYQAKQIVSYVGSGVSVLALAVSLVIFNLVRPTVKNDRIKAHINLTIALFFVHATQLTVDFAINNDVACLSTAVITHFFLLASFFWMLIEGIFLYLYVVQVFVHSSIEYLRWLYVMGWAIPVLIVSISAGVGIPYDIYLDLKPTYCKDSEVLYPPEARNTGSKYERCWLSAKTGMAWSFIGPALLIIVINTVILAKVFQVLLKVSGRSRNIRPLKPPTSSSSGNKGFLKDSTSTFSNKSYGRNDSQEETKYKTSEVKDSKLKIGKPDIEADYGSTSAAHNSTNDNKYTNAKSTGSPSRFDGRIPSQAYMYNRTQITKASPLHEDSDGKHFIDDVKAAAKGAMILLPILGIPWICGMWVGNNYVLMMIFIVINSTQGLVIFIVYCLMNGEVKRATQRQFRLAKIRSQSSRSRIGSTSSLRSLNSRFVRSWGTKTSTVDSHK